MERLLQCNPDVNTCKNKVTCSLLQCNIIPSVWLAKASNNHNDISYVLLMLQRGETPLHVACLSGNAAIAGLVARYDPSSLDALDEVSELGIH